MKIVNTLLKNKSIYESEKMEISIVDAFSLIHNKKIKDPKEVAFSRKVEIVKGKFEELQEIFSSIIFT